MKHGDKICEYQVIWQGYSFRYNWKRLKVCYRFRQDPVPDIGGSGKTYVRCCYRKVRTTQELRWYYAHKDLVRIRGRRSPQNIPRAWDDLPYARREKGWKRSKKKRQWM